MSGPSVAPSDEASRPDWQPTLPVHAAIVRERGRVDEVVSVMSEAEVASVKTDFWGWLEEMYHQENVGSFDDLMTRIIARGNPEQSEQTVMLFLKTFIDYIETKIDGGDPNIDQFGKRFSELLNEKSLAEKIGIVNHFYFLARASRHMILMPLLGVDDYWHRKDPWLIALSSEQIEPIVQKTESMRPGQLLDLVNFCGYLGTLFASDFEYGGEHRADWVKSVLHQIKNKKQSAFLNYSIDIALQKIDDQLAYERIAAGIDDFEDDSFSAIAKDLGITEAECIQWFSTHDDEIEKWESLLTDREMYVCGQLSKDAQEEYLALKRADIERRDRESSLGYGRFFEAFSTADQMRSDLLSRRISNAPVFPENYDKIPAHLFPVSSDYIGVFDASSTLQYVAPAKMADLSEPPATTTLDFKHLAQVTGELSFNPFQNVSAQDIPILLQQLHRPRMREMVERELGLKLEEMPLATQFQLLQFMAEESEETFAMLRQVLPGEGESRQHFLTAFLACAKERNYGHKILKLAEGYPDKAGKIFERFYQIISISQQEEKKLKKALADNPSLKSRPNLTRLYQTMIERGADLLSDAYTNISRIEDIDRYLQEAKRYQLKLIAFRGIFDAITAEDMHVTPEEIERLTADQIKAEITKGGRFLSFDPNDFSDQELSEKMLDESSYPDLAHFSKADYEMVVRNIRSTYKGIDEGWAEYLIGRIPYNLMNPDSNFILIRNEEGELVGVGRSDKLGDNHYYMGTFYVESGYQGIGRYIGEYLKTELPPGAEIEGTTTPANPATMWHIEINGYVGKHIVREGNSNPLIECSNFPGKAFLTKDKDKFSQQIIKSKGPGDLEDGKIKVVKVDTRPEKASESIESLQPFLEDEGYLLTRFFYDNPKEENPAANTWIVLEKAI